jgi:DNA-binding CsgD family transcriptional regulator
MPQRSIPATLRFGRDVASFKTPSALFSAMGRISERPGLNVHFGAVWRMPRRSSDFAALVPGKTVFLSERPTATEVWREFQELVRLHGGVSLGDYGRQQSVPFIMSETRRELRPVGKDDWIFRMLQKHGVRDALYIPFRHWTLGFWSERPLDQMPIEAQGVLFLLAEFGIRRLETLVKKPERFENNNVKLTDRELSTLRLMSNGKSQKEIAEYLEISSETVRTHLKKAVRKLKANNRVHAVAEAMRQGLLVV